MSTRPTPSIRTWVRTRTRLPRRRCLTSDSVPLSATSTRRTLRAAPALAPLIERATCRGDSRPRWRAESAHATRSSPLTQRAATRSARTGGRPRGGARAIFGASSTDAPQARGRGRAERAGREPRRRQASTRRGTPAPTGNSGLRLPPPPRPRRGPRQKWRTSHGAPAGGRRRRSARRARGRGLRCVAEDGQKRRHPAPWPRRQGP